MVIEKKTLKSEKIKESSVLNKTIVYGEDEEETIERKKYRERLGDLNKEEVEEVEDETEEEEEEETEDEEVIDEEEEEKCDEIEISSAQKEQIDDDVIRTSQDLADFNLV